MKTIPRENISIPRWRRVSIVCGDNSNNTGSLPPTHVDLGREMSYAGDSNDIGFRPPTVNPALGLPGLVSKLLL